MCYLPNDAHLREHFRHFFFFISPLFLSIFFAVLYSTVVSYKLIYTEFIIRSTNIYKN